jgi:acetyl-CoA carboxylase biotin carboxyl carrier protein
MGQTSASASAKDITQTVEKKDGNGSKKGKQAPEPSFNMEELRSLADLFVENGLTEFEFENENIRVRLSKMMAVPPAAALPPVAASPSGAFPISAPISAPTPATGSAEPAAEPDADADLHKIVSPIVGTFYRAPGPDKDAYVSEGSKVSPETTVCIVEAMKLMNEIQAEVSGEIVKVYVENGEPVEYGQPLFGVRK